MSVHKDRDSFRVKYRDTTGRQRSRSFTRKGDADAFDLDMRRRLQLGPAMARQLDRKVLTLEQFVATGFRGHAATLARDTRNQYAWALHNHLTELLDIPLIAIDVPMLADHQAQLLDSGRSANTVRDVMVRLSGILQVAVEHGLIPANPVRGLRKVPAEPRDEVRPLTPAQLEALIDRFAGRDRVIVVLAGQLGLRPQEIRKVPWHGFNGATLTIGRAHTKASARRARTIDVPTATAAHLHRWQLESGRPLGDRPIVGPMTESALTQWGWKHLGPAVHKLTGRDDVTCYTLRHTHASALHYCGYTVPAAARRLGHSGQVHLGYYAHVIDALEGRPQHANLDALIAAARNESSAGVPPLFRKAAKNT